MHNLKRMAVIFCALATAACASVDYSDPVLMQRAHAGSVTPDAPAAPARLSRSLSVIWDDSFSSMDDQSLTVGTMFKCGGAFLGFNELQLPGKETVVDALAKNTARHFVVDGKFGLQDDPADAYSGYSIAYSLYEADFDGVAEAHPGLVEVTVDATATASLAIRMTVREGRRILFQDLATTSGTVKSTTKTASMARCDKSVEELFDRLVPVLMADINARFSSGLQELHLE